MITASLCNEHAVFLHHAKEFLDLAQWEEGCFNAELTLENPQGWAPPSS